MRIDLKGSIAGQPAWLIRNMLRGMGHGRGGGPLHPPSAIASVLGIPESQVPEVVDTLLREDLIFQYDERPCGGKPTPLYRATARGVALALARGNRPLRRQTAQRQIDAFVDRILKANEQPGHLFRVEEAVLFGSCLDPSRATVNDIDIDLSFVCTIDDKSEYVKAVQAKIDAEMRKGRAFRNFDDQAQWPITEVLRFLQGSSRHISLHRDRRGMSRIESLACETLPLYNRESGVSWRGLP